MEIVRQPAVLKPFRIRASSTRGRPGGLPPEQVATIEGVVEVKASDDVIRTDTIRHLFPFADEAIKTIAGREEDDRRGVDFYGRGRVADLVFTMHDKEADDLATMPVIKGVVVSVIGRPRLAIDDNGDGTLHLKLRGVFTSDEVARLSTFVGADVFVTTSMHLPLFDASEKPVPIKDGKPDHAAAEPPAPTTTKRGAKAKGSTHDAILDGVLVTVGKKEVLRAEGAAENSGGAYDLDGILRAARTAARLQAEPGQQTVAVTREHIDGAIDALDAAVAEAQREAGADAVH